jgi:maltose O-acetyltransferase
MFASLRELLFLTLANHLPRLAPFDHARYLVLRAAGVRVRGRCLVWGPLVIRPIGGARNVEIGPRTFVNTEVRFGVPTERVVIGADVLIGPRAQFETVDHGLVHVPGRGRGRTSRPIVVEDEAWIGAGAILLPGVRVGRGAVVAAGAVVTQDVAPHTVVGGVPARFLRTTSEPAVGGAAGVRETPPK